MLLNAVVLFKKHKKNLWVQNTVSITVGDQQGLITEFKTIII